jgi:hypothetical protein
LIILSSILLCLSLLFSKSLLVVFKVFPQSILGVILFLTGAQLALGSCDFGKDKEDRVISLVTAGLLCGMSVWPSWWGCFAFC